MEEKFFGASVSVTPSVQVGDIVQVIPEKEAFGGCLMVVSEVKENGRIMAYLQTAGQQGQAYLFLNKDAYEHTGGRAVWVVA